MSVVTLERVLRHVLRQRSEMLRVCTSSLVSQLPPLPHNLQQQKKQKNSLFSPQEPAGYFLRVRSCYAPAQSLPITAHTLGKVRTPPPLHPAPIPPGPSASTFFTCPTPSNSDPASGLTGACRCCLRAPAPLSFCIAPALTSFGPCSAVSSSGSPSLTADGNHPAPLTQTHTLPPLAKEFSA